MRNNNLVENELNDIRTDFYERTKDMSPSEKIAYIKAKTAPIHERFDIHTIAQTKSE